jgi:hypothetical protein
MLTKLLGIISYLSDVLYSSEWRKTGPQWDCTSAITDFNKPLDSVRREVLYNILIEFGIVIKENMRNLLSKQFRGLGRLVTTVIKMWDLKRPVSINTDTAAFHLDGYWNVQCVLLFYRDCIRAHVNTKQMAYISP